MILGFDNDDATVFDAHREFLRKARITHAMVGMLTAIPKTPLYDRLASVGRLDSSDFSEFGTNVIPLRMSREALRDGYVQELKDLYEPEAFFGRVDDLYLKHNAPFSAGRRNYYRRYPARRLGGIVKDLSRTLGLFARLMRRVPEASLRRQDPRQLIGPSAAKTTLLLTCSSFTRSSVPCTTTITRWPGKWLSDNRHGFIHSRRVPIGKTSRPRHSGTRCGDRLGAEAFYQARTAGIPSVRQKKKVAV